MTNDIPTIAFVIAGLCFALELIAAESKINLNALGLLCLTVALAFSL